MPVTVILSKTMCAPSQAFRAGFEIAVLLGDLRAHGLQAFNVQIDGTAADGASAGHGDAGHAGAGDERAQVPARKRAWS